MPPEALQLIPVEEVTVTLVAFMGARPVMVSLTVAPDWKFSPVMVAATSAFRPTAQDGLVPFFDGRIVFPYWSRGQVVFMIGRRTPWTEAVRTSQAPWG